MKDILRLAVQKSGRLSEDSMRLLNDCDIHFNRSNRKLKSKAENFPLELLYLRDDDIPSYVADNVAEIGIVGENVVAELKKPVEIIERLGFSKCRLAIAAPRSSDIRDVSDLQGLNIATSYPAILTDFLKERNVKASLHEISGSVEIAPSIGLAEAVCDLVSSGSTLISNGLQEIETILHSQAVLIAGKEMPPAKSKTLEELLFRIKSVLRAKRFKYILMNAPNHVLDEVTRILPGIKSPTIMPLAIEGWSSVHSVIREDRFWEIIQELKTLGVEGVLVFPIENMIQ